MKISTAVTLTILLAAAEAPAANAQSDQKDAASLKATWRSTMSQTDTPDVGCYTAVYPDTAWKPVACGDAPNRPFMTDVMSVSLSSQAADSPETTGNGADYMASSTGGRKIGWATGSFPAESGVTRESDGGDTNLYSLQLNTNVMKTGPCAAAAARCSTWQQFIYESGSGSVFMQFWLINWLKGHSGCPAGWARSGTGCFINSTAAHSFTFGANALHFLSVTAAVARNGNDRVTFSVDDPGADTQSWAVTHTDRILSVSEGWTASEFNVFGDYNSTKAVFNAHSSLNVQNTIDYAATNGAAPGCLNTGTTGETNNLNRHGCNRVAGFNAGGGIPLFPPYIIFDESN